MNSEGHKELRDAFGRYIRGRKLFLPDLSLVN
jgi:hypothetical protein